MLFCHEEGSCNWFWRAVQPLMSLVMPPVRIEAVLADGGSSPLPSRWKWLRVSGWHQQPTTVRLLLASYPGWRLHSLALALPHQSHGGA